MPTKKPLMTEKEYVDYESIRPRIRFEAKKRGKNESVFDVLAKGAEIAKNTESIKAVGNFGQMGQKR